ncbi:MAG: chemotaxis protein CheX [Gemmatimonadota bacterium]|nr:chemotaxis protein CheX [Gemmatimonadota bacterium]MDH5760001.1 chemotaxis protein CheX [Gemmatimonadota bacterium]
MTSELQSELLRATTSTFEDLAFAFPEAEIEDHQLEAPLAWGARVAFSGPVNGTLDIQVTDGVAAELAANMLGMHDASDDGMKRDALGEIANVICGNVVPSLGKASDVFDLRSPEVYVVGTDGEETSAGATRLVVGIDGGRAEITVRVMAHVVEGAGA